MPDLGNSTKQGPSRRQFVLWTAGVLGADLTIRALNRDDTVAKLPREKIVLGHKASTHPINRVKMLANRIGIQNSTLIDNLENKYDKILGNVIKVIEANDSYTRRPNENQLRDFIAVIHDEIKKELPFFKDQLNDKSSIDELNVLHLFEAFRDDRSDCDTRALLVKTILDDLKIEHDLEIAVFPSHAALFMPAVSKRLGAPIFAELNSSKPAIFQNLADYYHILGPEMSRDFKIKSHDMNTDLAIVLSFFKDDALTMPERMRAFDYALNLVRNDLSLKESLLKEQVYVLNEEYKKDPNPEAYKELKAKLVEQIKTENFNQSFVSSYLFFLVEHGDHAAVIDFVENNVEELTKDKFSTEYRLIKSTYTLSLIKTNAGPEKLSEMPEKFPNPPLITASFLLDEIDDAPPRVTLSYPDRILTELYISALELLEMNKSVFYDSNFKAFDLEELEDRILTSDDPEAEALKVEEELLLEADTDFKKQLVPDFTADVLRIVNAKKLLPEGLDQENFAENSYRANLLLLRIFALNDEDDKVVKLKEYLESQDPDNRDLLKLQIKFAKDHSPEHKQALKAYLKVFPISPRQTEELAAIYVRQGRNNKALKLYRDLRDHHPETHLKAAYGFMSCFPYLFSREDLRKERKYLKENFPNLSSQVKF